MFAWDDASNNKWLISGKGALIMNPPSAWAVAKRDNPKLAEQLWTFFPSPKGPKGRFQPAGVRSTGAYGSSQTTSPRPAACSTYLSQRSAVEQLVTASGGYDVPQFSGLRDFKIWAEIGPPKGTLYNYPNINNHQILSLAGAPAPHKIGEQIYVQALMTQMAVRYFRGEAMEKTLDWAANELEGFTRN